MNKNKFMDKPSDLNENDQASIYDVYINRMLKNILMISSSSILIFPFYFTRTIGAIFVAFYY